ncbi:putative GNAT family N-acetyltransferase [Paratrimastix pyriformis]|uniref:GNAT family N-acetyltransferase n=1 Tax=Paratrimastix pyriformis TaxID=342808 RepID=A0ABQ8UJT6_9EUKA|nr:putative GNAT family N-acetyltransferase [Paratrimastix pyriformis]
MSTVIVRDQTQADCAAVFDLVQEAFSTMKYACGREQIVASRLFESGEAVMLVAEDQGVIVGQASFSRVKIQGAEQWWGLGPIATTPSRQRQGIARKMLETGLARLRTMGAAGCVLVGDPAFYMRFGFLQGTGLYFEGVPAENFLALPFTTASVSSGQVHFHAAFDACAP